MCVCVCLFVCLCLSQGDSLLATASKEGFMRKMTLLIEKYPELVGTRSGGGEGEEVSVVQVYVRGNL